jgi:hypothetical protein
MLHGLETPQRRTPTSSLPFLVLPTEQLAGVGDARYACCLDLTLWSPKGPLWQAGEQAAGQLDGSIETETSKGSKGNLGFLRQPVTGTPTRCGGNSTCEPVTKPFLSASSDWYADRPPG